MNAKEKAQELVTDYRSLLSLPNAPLGELKDKVAKQCALKAVDEIIEELLAIINDKSVVVLTDALKPTVKFWQQVKTEITNL